MGKTAKPAERRKKAPAPGGAGPVVHVAAADAPTAGHAKAALEAAGLKTAVLGRKDALPAGIRALLLAPDASPGSHRLAEARTVRESGGAVFCWSGARPDPAGGDAWLAGRILAQHGAFVSPSLPALASAARLWLALGGPAGPAPAAVRLGGKACGLRERLRDAVERAGVPATRGRVTGAIEIDAGEDGSVIVKAPGGEFAAVVSIGDLAAALALLRTATVAPGGDAAEPEIDRDVLAQIVRPPARLLSEMASKRLLAAAGIRAPAERLCGSASEAARFAAELDGPVVLKLVRPGLERKRVTGAVITGASGAATVRRAYHELARLGEELAPPRPLGVLVAATVEGGQRVWCAARRHPAFGAVALLGRGDEPAADPEGAVALPAGPGQARHALALLLPGAGEGELSALAAAVSGLGALLGAGGDMLDRVEIHPLVVPEGGREALALDALAAVSDSGVPPEGGER